jgi:hypothetical protein
MLPSQWDSLAKDDQNMLLAYWRTRRKMDAWEAYQLQLEIEKIRRNSNSATGAKQ